MPNLPPATPHDALFRALLADPGRAETLVREYLPPAVAAELSDAPIRLVDASFVDAVLHQSHSDRLFEAHLRDGGIAFVYVLLEHKAAPDPGTPLQMLGYMVRIWQRYAEDRASRLRALPPIVPLIFYHGRERWSEALSVAEMIAGEGELAAFARRLCCVLHDLGQRPLAALSGHPAVWSGLAALVAALRGQPAEGVLRRILSGVPDESELELQVLSYIVSGLTSGSTASATFWVEKLSGTQVQVTLDSFTEIVFIGGNNQYADVSRYGYYSIGSPSSASVTVTF